MFGLLLILLLSIAIVYLTIKFIDEDKYFGLRLILIIVFGSISMFLLLWILIGRMEYAAWEKSFEILRGYANSNSGYNLGIMDTKKIIDIVDANKDLAELQGRYLTWKWFSIIPARVMDILPIL